MGQESEHGIAGCFRLSLEVAVSSWTSLESFSSSIKGKSSSRVTHIDLFMAGFMKWQLVSSRVNHPRETKRKHLG